MSIESPRAPRIAKPMLAQSTFVLAEAAGGCPGRPSLRRGDEEVTMHDGIRSLRVDNYTHARVQGDLHTRRRRPDEKRCSCATICSFGEQGDLHGGMA